VSSLIWHKILTKISMRRITVGTTVQVFEGKDELEGMDLQLMAAATEAVNKSYAPYSNFYVGAAALLDNGAIVSGANQENASYPLALCAEMVLLSTISSEHPDAKIETIAITVKNEHKQVDIPISPCGACRQTMLEFEMRQQNQPITVLLMGEIGAVYKLDAVAHLLPLSFDGSML